MFIKLSWIFLAAASLFYFIKNIDLNDPSFYNEPLYQKKFILSIGFCFLAFLGHFIKSRLFYSGMLQNKYIYYADRIVVLMMISFIILYSDIGTWMYIVILMPIIVTSLSKGLKPGLMMLACSFVIHLTLFLSSIFTESRNGVIMLQELYTTLFSIISLYIMFTLITILTGMVHKDGMEYDIENKNLLEQLEEKYLLLEIAQDEILLQYEKLQSTNSKLEEANKKLSKSIAEFYTLQQISQAISSILDIKELLKHLNDITIGVMGVSYSTIILYDERANRLRVHTTNIKNPAEMATMTDNINSGELLNALNLGQSILENDVDPQQYFFTKGRDIKSLICIPLNTKSRKFGLILVEHTYTNAFDAENVRLLDIIAQQVGIVMENVELYNKMSELARKDGLTGVFNRQYFQERLDIEFRNAREENYPLSLAIFDVDYFKKFNDTFGHMFGDKVLVSIVDAVAATLRKNDIIARYGGEEFIILFPRTNLNEAYEKAEALRKLIMKHVVTDHLISTSVTISFGVSSYDECALNEHDLIRTADDALYEAKAADRNCVRIANRLLNL